MAARLPTPGSDDGTWGQILNDFLAQAHNTDGSIKSDAVGSSALQDNSVTQNILNTGTGTDGQVLTKDSAQTGGMKWSTVSGGASPATSSSLGTVQLAGDLGGVATAPTVPGLATKEPTITAGTTSQYWRGDKSWQTLDKSAVGLANVDNTSDTNKPVSTATQTALNAKAPLASPTFTGTVTVPTPTNNTDAATKIYVDTATSGIANKADKTTTITAGTGLTGGGDLSTNRTISANVGTTSGTLAAGDDSRITGAVQKSTVTTKGDLLAATTSATLARLGIGTDGQILTADSTQTTGIKWATGASAGVTQLKGVAVYVEDYGAKGDVRSVQDGGMTSASTTLTSSTAAFTAGDVGKAIGVRGAAASGIKLKSTISSVTNGTTVVLANAASNTVSNAQVDFGTDDTAAIQAAINDVVAKARLYAATSAGGTNGQAEVRFQSLTYMIAGALVQGGSTKGNSQLTLPIIPEAEQVVTLTFKGAGDNATLPHWNQTTPQRGGTTLLTVSAGTNDNTYGEACVLAGPNPAQGYGDAAVLFSNMRVIIDGINIGTPSNPTICGMDFAGVAQAHVKSMATFPDITNGTGPVPRGGTTDYQFGLRMPSVGNQSMALVDTYTSEGQLFAIVIGEHTIIRHICVIYGGIGIQCTSKKSNFDNTYHQSLDMHADIGECYAAIQTVFHAYTLQVLVMTLEGITGPIISDSAGALLGEIHMSKVTGNVLTSEVQTSIGCKVIDLKRQRGPVTAPGMPATTVALTNPFFRDAMVGISGGVVTDVSVQGTSQGASPAMVFVPSGATVTLTYSSAPTWIWTLV